MTGRLTIVAMIVVGAVAGALVGQLAGTSASTSDSCSPACVHRVTVRTTRAKWRAAVNAYGRGLLAARRACESGGDGGYRLDTTGNGYWFAYQHNPQAWAGAGGRIRGGRPVGVWTRHPSPLEQDYRAVVWDHRHAGDAWPNCP